MVKETKDILQELRTSRGLSMRDVSNGSDIQYTLYTKYEYGEREPGISSVRKLAQFYKVSADVILGIEPIPEPDAAEKAKLRFAEVLENYFKILPEQRLEVLEMVFNMIHERERKLKKQEISMEQYKEEIRTIFVTYYSDPVSAGTGTDLLPNDEPEKQIEVIATAEAEKASFAVRVSGDSMTPTFDDGDIILARECSDVDIGEIGVFEMDGEGYVKEYGGDTLISHNPNYPPIPIIEPLRCAGRVLGKADLP